MQSCGGDQRVDQWHRHSFRFHSANQRAPSQHFSNSKRQKAIMKSDKKVIFQPYPQSFLPL